jgi:hypothetical protein
MPMLQASAKIALCSLVLWCASGCASVYRSEPRPANPPGPESVSFDVYTIRVPLADAEINGSMWSEVDEQQLPAELRRHLADNGFRAGVVGNHLPLKLEQLLQLRDQAPAKVEIGGTVTDFENEPQVRQRHMQVMAGHPANIICTGEHSRHAELSVLIRGADGQVNGRTYRKVMGLLAVKAFPQGDSRARIEVVPELEHGDAARRFEPSEGALRVEFSPPHEKFDLMRIESLLSPGQLLLITCRPDRPGSLGYQFFTDTKAAKAEQKLLLVRLVQSRYDNLFDTVAAPTAPRPADKN